MIKIPEKLGNEDQKTIDYIATKICGAKKVIKKPHHTDIEFWEFPSGELITVKYWNPFTNIEHAKMLDGWLVENNLEIIIHNSGFDCEVEILTDTGRTIVKFLGEKESHCRTVAILKAYIKLALECNEGPRSLEVEGE
jgi:hypothetical protein